MVQIAGDNYETRKSEDARVREGTFGLLISAVDARHVDALHLAKWSRCTRFVPAS